MVSEVNGPGVGNSVATNEQRAQTVQDTSKPAALDRREQNSGTPIAQDSVILTEAASRLQDLQKIVTAAPEVDMQRVDQLRGAIADGSFQIDSNSVAQKLLQFEAALPSASSS